jgi:hypothetical protein
MHIAPGTERPRQLAGFSNAPEGQRDVTSPKSGRFGLIGRYAYSSGVGALDHVCAVPVWRITGFR